jgi:hypothetical protein
MMKTKSSRFEEDKRLFRYDVEDEPLEKWEAHFRQGWQKLQQVYQEADDDPEIGLKYFWFPNSVWESIHGRSASRNAERC